MSSQWHQAEIVASPLDLGEWVMYSSCRVYSQIVDDVDPGEAVHSKEKRQRWTHEQQYRL